MNFDFLEYYNNTKSIKEMTLEERAEYKKQKKKIRQIQVAAEIFTIVLVVVAAVVLIVGKVTKKDVEPEAQAAMTQTVTEQEEEKPKKEEVEEEGLKVKAMLQEPESETDEDQTEAEVEAKYFAKETEATCAIPGEVISSYGILINNDTNEIVATKNAYDRMIPASMTKVMTVYTAWKHMTPEKLDEKVVLSNEAVSACYKADCATSGFVEGEEVTVKDLFYGTILPSGGDAAVQLALVVGGDVDSFMNMVNEDLKELGLSKTTHFTNPIGYYDDEHYSTAYDIAMILKAAMDDEFLADVLSTKVYYSTATNVNPEGIIISNWFLRRIEDKSFGGEIIGAKTGYVDESGSCAVSCERSEGGTMYICCTGKSSSSWNAIGDHVKIYSSLAH